MHGLRGDDADMMIERFMENIIEQIKEAQLKLGFVKEVIRLYFPVSSLENLLQVHYGSGVELLAFLEKEKKFTDTVLGEIKFSLCKDDRIEVCISPEGAAYVHEQIADPVFLKHIIRLFQENHHLTVEEICACFAQFNEHYVCEKMKPEADFDYVLYFPDQKPDAWYYCVKMEIGHTIYHRFTREDYYALIQE